jgi:hypothetical protein
LHDEKYYYDHIKFINDGIQNYTKINIQCVKDIIDEYFRLEQIYKIERFQKIKEDLKNRIEIDFNDLLQKNIEKIKNTLENECVAKYLQNRQLSMSECNNKIFGLYKLFVLYPLLKIKVEYTNNDYVESEEYKRKRNELLDLISKTQRHYNSINNLQVLSYDDPLEPMRQHTGPNNDCNLEETH